MSQETTDKSTEKDTSEIVKEEFSVQFQWYFLGFISSYFLSWAIPAVCFFAYIFWFFYPYFLLTDNFLLLFTELKPLLAFLFFPGVLLICYFLHLFTAASVTRFWWRLSEKIEPSKEGVIPRNVRSKASNLYHIRSFLIKYPKYIVSKGLFPWLYTWVFNFIGSTEYGKEVTVEEEVVGDRFIVTGNNCYVGPNSSLASHLVEGIFGNINYFKVKLGDNVTIPCENHIGPGSHLEDNSYLFPMGAALKFTENKGDNYYFGMPIRKIFTRKIKKYLQIGDEELDMAENLAERQHQKKKKGDKSQEM